MYLSSFSMLEPQDGIYIYYPCWLNVWESHLYKQALKSTGSHAWGFRRFGTHKDAYIREMIRTPPYKAYIDAMEQVSEAALQKLTARERMLLLKSRTAFIYVDSWGESAPFEDISSALHTATIDTLPKNLVKKFSVTDFTCKIRGEKQSLVQAMQVAEDYLNWQVFDYVVICAAYRAVPVLVFSEEDIRCPEKGKNRRESGVMNLSVERVGCFIFSRREAELSVNCGGYSIQDDNRKLIRQLVENHQDINLFTFSGLRKGAAEQELLKNGNSSVFDVINLIDTYGGSGCLSPALSWIYLEQQAREHGKMRTLVPDNFGGYNWFDTRY
ncbi:MAG: ATP-binding protein [Pantoea sp.]|uniref:ATP-binding protein n=1 Tax=Pantoea sp. TaxID=69393 RepID=UPI0039E4078A